MNEQPRAGSRKAAVFEAFAKDGADVAIATGISLGLKLGTVRSWIGTWLKGAPDGDTNKSRPRATLGKPQVFVTWDPERPAYLIEEGPEVSAIRWADDNVVRFIPNEFLSKPGK